MSMDSVVVGISDCRVTSDIDSVLVTDALGSCIAVVVHDPVTKASGLLHYMLPESSVGTDNSQQNPFMFADTGIPRLIEAVRAAGGEGKRFVVRLAGGAQLVDSQGVFQIGKRNYLAGRKILWKAGILIAGEAVGGEVSRTTRLEVNSGRMWVREGAAIEREVVRKEIPNRCGVEAQGGKC